MDDLIYILCKDKTQKIYYYTSKNVQDIEIIEIPLQDYTNYATTNVKKHQYLKLFYPQKMYKDEIVHCVHKRMFLPIIIAKSIKTIFAQIKNKFIRRNHFYILCDDGVYTIPSETDPDELNFQFLMITYLLYFLLILNQNLNWENQQDQELK